MSNTQSAHYFVVRYMYNELGDEAANIGVIVAGRNAKEVTYRFLDDLKAKDRGDRQINRAVVADFRGWLEREVATLSSQYGVDNWLPQFEERLREKTGNVIRVLGPRSVLTSDPHFEVRALFNQWVAPQGEWSVDQRTRR
jgi:Protein of unknown function (DUF3037)